MLLNFSRLIKHTVYNNINDITIEAESLYDSSLDYKGMLVQLDQINIRTYTDEVYELAYNDVFYYPNNAYNKRGYYYYTGTGFSQSDEGVTGPLNIPPQNSPTGDQSWFTNKFYFKGNINYDVNSSLRLAVNDLKNSTIEYEKDGINYNMLEFNVAFEKRSNAEARALLKFLDDKAGFKIFEYNLPQPYNKTINVFCPEWNHTYNFLNNNDHNINVESLQKLNIYNLIPKEGFFRSSFSFFIIALLNLFPLLKIIKRDKPNFLIIHLLTILPIILSPILYRNTKIILRISGFPNLKFGRGFFWKLFSKYIYAVTTPTKLTSDMLIENKIFI